MRTMKTTFINILAIVVIVFGLMAFSAPTASYSLADKSCCGDCCGDVCELREDEEGISCKAKSCSFLRELFKGCSLD